MCFSRVRRWPDAVIRHSVGERSLRGVTVPFIEAGVFLSNEDLRYEFDEAQVIRT